MTSRTSLLTLAIVCALQPLCFAPPLAARQSAAAGSAVPAPSCPKVDPPAEPATNVGAAQVQTEISRSTTTTVEAPSAGAAGDSSTIKTSRSITTTVTTPSSTQTAGTRSIPPAAATPSAPPAPTITGLRIDSLTGPPDCKHPCVDRAGKPHCMPQPGEEATCAGAAISPTVMAHFKLAILGTHLLSTSSGEPSVQLNTQDAGKPIANQQILPIAGDNEIDVSGDAPLGTVIKVVKVGSACNDTFSVAFTAKTGALQKFQVKLDHETNAQFPNLHSLLLTKQGGDGGFDAKPSHMTVELQPTGATDLRIVETSAEQLDLHFVAAATYVPTNAVVTVYNSGDLDSRTPIALAALAAAADPNAPTITSVETVFLDRGNGNGRIRIHGKGFGKQASASFPVDDYLCDCLERPQVDGYKACGFLDDVRGLPIYPKSSQEQPATDDESARLETPEAANDVNKKALADRYEEGERLDELAASRNKAANEELGAAARLGHHLWSPQTDTNLFCRRFGSRWAAFQGSLRGKVSVGVDSMNPEVRVQKTYIMDFNDQVIDVYFEFTRHRGYAWPFRIGNVTVAVTKDATSAQQTVTTPSVDAEVDKTGPTAYSVSQLVGPAPDPNLTYQYTVLTTDAARSLLGHGVSDHFWVLQLSVVNHGTSPVAVPLGSIQAEVEWLRGSAPKKGNRAPQYFMEGPPTVAPMPLGSVSAYYGVDQKFSGPRTIFFNILTGITTFVAAVVPFAGPALKDAQGVFTGGFVPAMGEVWTDLSAQQLQNLTTLSWGSSETVTPGSSTQGYIYIQRKVEEKGDLEPTTGWKTVRQISNIMALDVTSFAVSSIPSVPATPAATPAASPSTLPAATPSTTPAATATATTTVTRPAPKPAAPAT